jgi:hypothetical protein
VALDRIGYAGQLVIESFTLQIEQIARAVSLWRSLADSPDALATAPTRGGVCADNARAGPTRTATWCRR